MNMPWKNLHGAAKIVAVCAAILLTSAGLCGAQMAVLDAANAKGSDNLTGIFMITGLIEIAAMLISVLVGFIALLVWGFGSLFSRDRSDRP